MLTFAPMQGRLAQALIVAALIALFIGSTASLARASQMVAMPEPAAMAGMSMDDCDVCDQADGTMPFHGSCDVACAAPASAALPLFDASVTRTFEIVIDPWFDGPTMMGRRAPPELAPPRTA